MKYVIKIFSCIGWYPNLDLSQKAAAAKIKKMIDDEGLSFNYDRENEYLKILRFLRARKYDVNLTMDLIRNDVKWRVENRVCDLKDYQVEDIIELSPTQMFEHFPAWVQGFDKEGRPVSYRKFGQLDCKKVLTLTTMENLVRFHVWETEQALRLLYEQSEKMDANIETFTVVVDADGFGLRLFTNEAIAFAKALAITDSDHYPERLGTLFVINAPSVLWLSWRIVQTFLDEVTRKKIQIFSSDRSEWEPVLKEHIDVDQIPRQYGGTAPDLSNEDCIRQMNPPRSPERIVTDSNSEASKPLKLVSATHFDPFPEPSTPAPATESTKIKARKGTWILDVLQCTSFCNPEDSDDFVINLSSQIEGMSSRQDMDMDSLQKEEKEEGEEKEEEKPFINEADDVRAVPYETYEPNIDETPEKQQEVVGDQRKGCFFCW
jgi:hypothetical protein